MIGSIVAVEMLYPDGSYIVLNGKLTAVEGHLFKLEECSFEDITPPHVRKSHEASGTKRGTTSSGPVLGSRWVNTMSPVFVSVTSIDSGVADFWRCLADRTHTNA